MVVNKLLGFWVIKIYREAIVIYNHTRPSVSIHSHSFSSRGRALTVTTGGPLAKAKLPELVPGKLDITTRLLPFTDYVEPGLVRDCSEIRQSCRVRQPAYMERSVPAPPRAMYLRTVFFKDDRLPDLVLGSCVILDPLAV